MLDLMRVVVMGMSIGEHNRTSRVGLVSQGWTSFYRCEEESWVPEMLDDERSFLDKTYIYCIFNYTTHIRKLTRKRTQLRTYTAHNLHTYICKTSIILHTLL